MRHIHVHDRRRSRYGGPLVRVLYDAVRMCPGRLEPALRCSAASFIKHGVSAPPVLREPLVPPDRLRATAGPVPDAGRSTTSCHVTVVRHALPHEDTFWQLIEDCTPLRPDPDVLRHPARAASPVLSGT
ncbi:conserved hypothetical protein [Streptomyces pristinaespiralis ATCC 25486]|uniref:Uncharacterized protein n=1 Tax=Streptomyces pristinaespiralis (strain ATCC 25486 / DSM 40338 / CBS 914.69 / JCM 4507 / KCC S-0507 / NBRC 13074 / NRRL 2958 / 5647) TaxID=457429 RepID=B5HAJ2_STRE2|nr:conserved hypothetical protein [Streptomyces pristinaespiralis ATCC 25486]